MVTAAAADAAADLAVAGVIRSLAGGRAGTARSTAATMRFRCEFRAKAATRQIRGSAGPEKRILEASLKRGISKSRAISIAVTSHFCRCVTLIYSLDAASRHVC